MALQLRKWMPMAIQKASVSLCGALTWVPVLQNKAVKAVSKISPTWLLFSGCQGQLRLDQVGRSTVFHASKPRNMRVSHFLLFSNSAPVQFTKNGKAYANKGVNGSNLSDNHYADFADFLTTTTKHFTDRRLQHNPHRPSKQPQYDWTEGRGRFTMDQRSDIAKLAREFDKSITKQGLSAQILLPEACQWKAPLSDGTEKRPTIR